MQQQPLQLKLKQGKTMTKNEIYPSRWIKAADLDREGENVTIRNVTVEEVGENREKKPVIEFDELDRNLIVNVTNWNTIAEITGQADSDNWPGRKIKLVRVRVPFGGKTVEAIRVESADQVKPKPARRTLPKLKPIDDEFEV
jgi:hypothetical protein